MFLSRTTRFRNHLFIFFIYFRVKYVAVSFYKRAQILIAEIWLIFNGHGLGHFPDIVRTFHFISA